MMRATVRNLMVCLDGDDTETDVAREMWARAVLAVGLDDDPVDVADLRDGDTTTRRDLPCVRS